MPDILGTEPGRRHCRECARQAVLDFNLAGKVTIIGCHASPDILTAVEKGVLALTCDVDTEQMGKVQYRGTDRISERGQIQFLL